MRRSDREITDKSAIEEFIAGEKIIRIGFCDNGEVYIVPVNYGYTMNDGSYTFYFHGAAAGRKFDLATSSPDVGFEIDGRYKLIEADKACGHSANYQSVIGSGVLSIISDKAEKISALNSIMKQSTGKADWEYPDAALEKTAVYRLEVKKMTCKAR